MHRHEYDRLAPRYDQRWRRYLDLSLNATLARLPLSGGEVLLDVGCGTGELLRRLRTRAPSLSLIGLDVSAAMLAVARKKLPDEVRLLRAAADNLPLAPSGCNVVTLTSALHHLPRPAAALAEIRRVLKPGGRLILTDWRGDYFFYRALSAWLRFTGRPVEHIYSVDECQALLARSGFQITGVDSFNVDWRWKLMAIVAERD